jgi:hypothetical protein
VTSGATKLPELQITRKRVHPLIALKGAENVPETGDAVVIIPLAKIFSSESEKSPSWL